MAEKTKIEKYKKTEEQFLFEKENIIQPLKKLVPPAPSGRARKIDLPKYISFTIYCFIFFILINNNIICNIF